MNSRFLEFAITLYAALHILGACIIYSGFYAGLSSGYVALLWALLSIGLALWLRERVIFLNNSKRHAQNALPEKLLAGMDRQHIYNQGIYALKSLNPCLLFVLLCGALYLVAGIWSSVSPLYNSDIELLNEQISTYFKARGFEQNQGFEYLRTLYAIMASSAFICIIGVSFWMAQLFRYGAHAGNKLIFLLCALFATAFIVIIVSVGGQTLSNLHLQDYTWLGYGWSRMALLQNLDIVPTQPLSPFQIRYYQTGLLGIGFSYIPACTIVIILLKNLIMTSGYYIYAAAGLSILAMLAYADIYMPYHPAYHALWLSGWSALAILCVPVQRQGVRKKYQIYQ